MSHVDSGDLELRGAKRVSLNRDTAAGPIRPEKPRKRSRDCKAAERVSTRPDRRDTRMPMQRSAETAEITNYS